MKNHFIKLSLTCITFLFVVNGIAQNNYQPYLYDSDKIDFNTYKRLNFQYLYGVGYDNVTHGDRVKCKTDKVETTVKKPKNGTLYEGTDPGQGFTIGFGMGGNMLYDIFGKKFECIGFGFNLRYRYVYSESEMPIHALIPALRFKMFFIEGEFGPSILLYSRKVKRFSYFEKSEDADYKPIFTKGALQNPGFNMHTFFVIPINQKIKLTLDIDMDELYFKNNIGNNDDLEWIGLGLGLLYYLD